MNHEQADLYQRIIVFPLDEPNSALPFGARLARENNWTRAFANRVVGEYKRFAFLAVAAGHYVAPSDEVDQAWHMHLTYTRSYWDEFCPHVLGTSLHHHPTQGGAAELDKFKAWYGKTLESYERLFGHEPPADIWPDVETRFSGAADYRRVNTSTNWIVPRQPARWLARLPLFGVLSTYVVIAGSAVAEGSAGRPLNSLALLASYPFDLKGAQFLKFFILALACAVLVALLVRYALCIASEPWQEDSVELDAYELAYLNGGRRQATAALLTDMVNRRILSFDPFIERLVRNPEYQDDGSMHPAEREVQAALDAVGSRPYELAQYRWQWQAQIAERLTSLRLIATEARDFVGRAVPILIVMTVPALGAAKIYVGLSRDKPVGFLVIGCVLAAAMALVVFGQPLHRTTAGNRVLRRHKREHSKLKRHLDQVDPAHMPLAVGLFGVGVLAGGSLNSFQAAFAPKAVEGGSSSWGGSGCGGGGCGGGGCGGGCGGCGGCG